MEEAAAAVHFLRGCSPEQKISPKWDHFPIYSQKQNTTIGSGFHFGKTKIPKSEQYSRRVCFRKIFQFPNQLPDKNFEQWIIIKNGNYPYVRIGQWICSCAFCFVTFLCALDCTAVYFTNMINKPDYYRYKTVVLLTYMNLSWAQSR